MSHNPLAAIEELIMAESAAAIHGVVVRHPELLEDSAIVAFAKVVEKVDDNSKPIVNRLLALLLECRAVGIDEAFEDFESASPRLDLTEGLTLLIQAQDAAEMKDAFEQCPELLGDAAERMFLEWESDSSPYSADRYYAIIQFLRACRCGDMDAACAAYERDRADIAAAASLAMAYLLMEDAKEGAEFLDAHPVLLGRQAERILADLLDAFIESNPQGSPLLELMRVKLDAVRRLRMENRIGG